MTKLTTNNEIRHELAPVQTAFHLAIRRLLSAADALGIAPLPDSTKDKIKIFSRLFGVDPAYALAVAKVESNMGKYQRSHTGARGVYQMTTIAMRDLWLEMEKQDDDIVDIAIGILFLRLLKQRWGTEEVGIHYFCDPKDRNFWVPKVKIEMEKYRKEGEHEKPD